MRAIIFCLVTSACLPAFASGQSGQDETAVRVTAIRYLQEGKFRADTLVLHPDDVDLSRHARYVTRPSAKDRARPEAMNRAIQSATAVTLSSAKDAVVCDGTDRYPNCSIRGGSALVALGIPEIAGDSATMRVHVVEPGGRNGTLDRQTIALTLWKKPDGTWQVIKSDVIFVT